MPQVDREGRCLTPSCGQMPAASCKGLCMKCYSAAKKLVTGGQTTWEQLADMGLAEHMVDAFTAEFNKRKGGLGHAGG